MLHSRRLFTLFLGLVVVFSLMSGPAGAYYAPEEANTWFVTTGGSDANTCASPSQPCKTINGAIAKAAAGGVVKVAVGTYQSDQDVIVTISKNLTLSGGWNTSFTSRTGYSTVDGTALSTDFTTIGVLVPGGCVATIENFIVQNVPSPGTYHGSNHGLRNEGVLTLNNSIVANNSTAFEGGGIYNMGVLTINDSTIKNNWASYNGAGIYNQAELTINRSTISNNNVRSLGGGIYHNSDKKLVISNSVITGNNRNMQFPENRGGGLAISRGVVEISGSTISYNTAGRSGGGIRLDGSATITLTNSVVYGNTAYEDGGGIYQYTGTLAINNSTISHNTSSDNGGGIYNSGTTRLSNVTISHNQANSGGGLYNSGNMTPRNTLIANNEAVTGPDCQNSEDWGTFLSAGYNIFGSISSCPFGTAEGDQINVDPQITDLAGVLRYNPLPRTSPAVNAGNPAGCLDDLGNPLLTDQRGFSRPDRCDIGAYEYAEPGSPAKAVAAGGTPQKPRAFQTFPSPIIVVVLDGAGSPIDGADVTFTAPDAGPSSTFPDDGGTNTAVLQTDVRGLAQVYPKANGIGGSYQIAAAASSGTAAKFSITNMAQVFMPAAFKDLCGDYSDDFSNPATGWPIIYGDYFNTEYWAGEYQVKTKMDGYFYTLLAPSCPRADYSVEADFHWEGDSGDSYGLIIAVGDGSDGLIIFDMNTDLQMYRVFWMNDYMYSYLISPYYSSAIRPGNQTNHLSISFVDRIINVRINGIFAGNADDSRNPDPGKSDVGIMVSPYEGVPNVTVHVDNFTILGLPSSADAAALDYDGTEGTGTVPDSQIAPPWSAVQLLLPAWDTAAP